MHNSIYASVFYSWVVIFYGKICMFGLTSTVSTFIKNKSSGNPIFNLAKNNAYTDHNPWAWKCTSYQSDVCKFLVCLAALFGPPCAFVLPPLWSFARHFGSSWAFQDEMWLRLFESYQKCLDLTKLSWHLWWWWVRLLSEELVVLRSSSLHLLSRTEENIQCTFPC